VALAAGLVIGLGPTASAQDSNGNDDTDPGIDLVLEAGIDGWVAPGRTYPVTAIVTADHRVRGELRVHGETPSGAVLLTRPIDLAGGTTEELGLLAPPGLMTGLLSIQAQLVVDGAVVATAEDDMRIDLNTEIVGMLPDVAARYTGLPALIPLMVADAGSAQTVPLDLDIVDLGPLALEPVDQIVSLPAELAKLSPARRATLATWVDRGGYLLIAGPDPGSAGEVLPDGWLPEPNGTVRAGLGQVRSVSDSWTAELLPSPTRSAHEEDLIAQDLLMNSDLGVALAYQARTKLPGAGGLGLLLIGYVLLMGPVAFLAVRTVRRGQLAWVVVPLLAVGSTGVAFGVGNSLSDAAGSAQVTVYETGPAGTMATTSAMLTNIHGGDVGVDLPAGWTAGPMASSTGTILPGLDVMRMRVDPGDGTTGGRLIADPPSGGAGSFTARGPARGTHQMLAVTATSETDGRVTGTVRNLLHVPLQHVVALVGKRGMADIGTLAAGEERPFEITAVTDFALGASPPIPEMKVWPADRAASFMADAGILPAGAEVRVPVGFDVDTVAPVVGPKGESQPDADDDSPVVNAAWNETLYQTGWNYRPPGQVVAVGWTDALPSPAHLRDGTARLARSNAAVVARGLVLPGGNRLTDAAVVRSYVRGSSTPVASLPAAAGGGLTNPAPTPEGDATAGVPPVGLDPQRGPADLPAGALFAFQLPATVGDRAVDIQRLMMSVPDRFTMAEIWTPSGWQTITVPDPGTGQVEVAVPPEAVVADMVFVRAAIDMNVATGHEFVLYEQEVAG
jgi:hypothetical protein